MSEPRTSFHDLTDFIALPRTSGLTLSPDGTRLVTTLATPNAKGTGYASALWEVDPSGERPAHRLTRSVEGEAGAEFAADGTLYFTSGRPAPGEEEKSSALWALPAQGGEARVVLTRPGGVSSVSCASAADTVVLGAPRLRGAATEAEHAELAKARKDAGVDAILHTGYPVRFWDHDLGPATPELFVLADGPDPDVPVDQDDASADHPSAATIEQAGGIPEEGEHHLRHLTGFDRSHGFGVSAHVAPDGSFALVTASRAGAKADMREWIARVDTATGEVTALVDEPGQDAHAGPISHDGTRAVIVVGPHTTPQSTRDPKLFVMDTATGELTPLAHDWDRWPHVVGWLPDDSAVIAVADQDGRAPLFRIDVPSGAVTQVTHQDEAWSDVVVSPDGTTLYGVRSSYLFPPEVARVDLATGEATRLQNPSERPAVPGTLEDVETTTEDGTRVRGWLALPAGKAPEGGHPLLLWIHGGPVSSWNAWSWRWNPWLMVAQGYAVLLPDPALSTGYGRDFVQRGWGRWGAEPYTDLMAITDAVEARADIDATRTAAMGGSFGGYMANWVAGHTDRFKAIVTHASLWALEGFGPTTDASFYWDREMSPEMMAANSPHRFVQDIVTPMLVIHGDKDYRVPIGEGLRLWYELLATSGLPAGEDGSTEHRFLYFPQENHWILTPQHAKVWYEVVQAFLAEKVLGEEAAPLPKELGLNP
ncbi:alpha/beta fold hydrolase [Micrococcus sp. FDAARGOS_333]|uniref:S9 family peptidase n=1 Tax=Micrococcus sp. FDAARGOS_333 TaxID=1930558 RepID=UPI000B4DF168|nr:alpha/beta fold hydrolase [Micrococcus sp. FDAARGOS_333]PNL17125.1 S9 family peptidase [Micrococcus sp. FDAARGOS_333]